MKFVVGLHGRKGVGKDFVGSIIYDELVYQNRRPRTYAFANAIKNFCSEVMGLDRNLCYGTDEDKNTKTQYSWSKMPEFVRAKYPSKNGKMTVREVLQVFGTEFMRECWDDGIWVKCVMRNIANSDFNAFVITDVRFTDELNAIKEVGGFNVFVDGPQRGEKKTLNDTHASEKGLDKSLFDFTIDNRWGTTKEDLREQIQKWLSTINIDQPNSKT